MSKKPTYMSIYAVRSTDSFNRLRHFRDPMELGPDGSPLGARIQALMSKIASDIKDAGSACDVYMRKSFLGMALRYYIDSNV